MSDAAHYQASLRGDAVQVSEGHAQVGYYRLRRGRNQPWLPVAIWKQDGELVCRVGPDMADPQATWVQCADEPVSKADALFAFQHNGWPGDAPAPIGHNSASDDPFTALTREVEAEAQRVRAWIAEPHEGETAANLAANWLTALRRLEDRTEAGFDAEKAPALAESNRIDTKWRGLKALAEQIKRQLSDRYDAIARKEKTRLQAIADAKAREETEKRRKQWEEDQAKQAALAQEHGLQVLPEEPPTPVITAPEVRVAFGGAQGSRIAPKKVPPTALVEDWAKAAAYYAGNAKVREIVQKLCDKAAKDGVEVPGVKIVQGE